jgi:hypothetical protein
MASPNLRILPSAFFELSPLRVVSAADRSLFWQWHKLHGSNGNRYL